jgi:hypothetical protein
MPGACAVHPGLPGAPQAGNASINKLIGVFTEVPDISFPVLSEPIERVFGEFAIGKYLVVALDGDDSINDFRIGGHGERGPYETLGRRALVNVRCSRFERHIGIVDVG